MKNKIKFIVVYSLCFMTMSVVSVAMFDKPPIGEMLSFVIYANLFYISISAICWVFINILVENIYNGVYRYFARLFLGLIVLNLFALFAGNKLPSIDLFVTKNELFWLNLTINLIYLFSLIVASMSLFPKWKKIVQPGTNAVDKESYNK